MKDDLRIKKSYLYIYIGNKFIIGITRLYNKLVLNSIPI